MTETKIIVLDDDPTGSQTVHSCLLLTRWDIDTLKQGLLDNSPLFFVLTNTRGMDAAKAASITREVCINLKQALAELAVQGRDINPLMVSRSDSTLRGHYPVETDVIAEELGPFDAHFIVPAFFEGGRITLDSIHYLMVNGKLVPVHETEFAKDSVFAYRHSYLPDYVEEKTRGKIMAGNVHRFLYDEVRVNSLPRLMALRGNVCCVVDAERQSDLNYFCHQLMQAAQQGKRFLFRSAASLLTAFAELPPQPVPAASMGSYTRGGKPGAVIVGSHVTKTTAQLKQLLQRDGLCGIEVDVSHLQQNYAMLLKTISEQIREQFHQDKSVVVYTSRTELQFASQAERLAFGGMVSRFLVDVVQQLPVALGFLISKGGITSNDVLSTGLALRASRVLGQILPGCSVVRCPDDHPRFAGMPVVIFPGNVGDDQALANIYDRMSRNIRAASKAA